MTLGRSFNLSMPDRNMGIMTIRYLTWGMVMITGNFVSVCRVAAAAGRVSQHSASIPVCLGNLLLFCGIAVEGQGSPVEHMRAFSPQLPQTPGKAGGDKE